MTTVATKLDVPIKLVYQSVSRSSMLGLGDIVIPGIFIGLALRFDLHQHYQKKAKYVATELVSEMTTGETSQVEKQTDVQYRKVKEVFVDPRGRWGDRFWTALVKSPRSSASSASILTAANFPKPYFYASMVGYAVGMMITLIILMIFKHGQPALFYLVPCVTGAVWTTGAVRGELRDVWNYTEDGSLDTEDVVVELDANGNVVKEISQKGVDDKEKEEAETEGGQNKTDSAETLQKSTEDYDVFSFSLKAPRYQAPKASKQE
jgi:minor histocompatibility antigen H13